MILTRTFLLLFALATISTGSASVFITPTTYPCGELPIAAVIQDFNHDGFSDIATANGNARNVSVFLNNGNGTFAPATTLSISGGKFDIASADLDGDGNFDLIVSDKYKSLNIALGHGDGTFGPASTITANTDDEAETRGIAVADLNADGIPDLAVAIYSGLDEHQGQVAILIGQGDGTFEPPVFYSLNNNATRLVATDLNNDGVLDLAVAVHFFNATNKGLAVLLGNGDGTFQPPILSIDKGYSSDVTAADLNGDGNMDLALAQDVEDKILVVLGNGDGTFQPATTYSGFSRLKAIDVSGDGIVDLVSDGGPTILLGDGSGGFGPPTFYSVGSGFAEVGYFNSDRTPDIVTGNFSAIAIAFGRAHGHLRAPTRYFPGGLGFDSVDFDSDGYPDVVITSSYGGPGLSFFRGLGDGTLANPVSISNLEAHYVIAADFNGDHKSDILFTRYNDSQMYTMLGNGDGTFQSAQTTLISLDEPWPEVADFNHDGKVDVAITGFFDDAFIILPGNGDGTFQPAIVTHTPDGPQSPIAADFNLDGNLDLVTSHAFISEVSVFLGHGDGTFDQPLTITSPDALYLAAGDLNRDGKPDLVVGGGFVVNVFLGNGDGTFGTPESVYSKYGPVQIADVDRDNRPDIVVSGGFDVLAVVRGEGDGSFRSAVEFPTGSSVGAFVLRDLNHDGLPEAIVSTDGTFTVLFNTSYKE